MINVQHWSMLMLIDVSVVKFFCLLNQVTGVKRTRVEMGLGHCYVKSNLNVSQLHRDILIRIQWTTMCFVLIPTMMEIFPHITALKAAVSKKCDLPSTDNIFKSHHTLILLWIVVWVLFATTKVRIHNSMLNKLSFVLVIDT